MGLGTLPQAQDNKLDRTPHEFIVDSLLEVQCVPHLKGDTIYWCTTIPLSDLESRLHTLLCQCVHYQGCCLRLKPAYSAPRPKSLPAR
jgi:hypothetical protein